MKKGIALLLALCLVVSLCACGKKEEDPNLGTYQLVYMQVEDTYLETAEEWMTLEAEGKGSTFLFGEDFTFDWHAEEAALTITQMGDDYYGTLKDGLLVIDFAGVVCTFAKEGAEIPEKQTAPTEVPDPVIGWYTLNSVEMKDVMQNKEQLELAGLDKGSAVFYEDHSGFIRMPYEKDMPFVYQNGIAFDGNGEFTYALEGDLLTITLGETVLTFLRAEGEAPTFIGE